MSFSVGTRGVSVDTMRTVLQHYGVDQKAAKHDDAAVPEVYWYDHLAVGRFEFLRDMSLESLLKITSSLQILCLRR